MGFSQLGVFGKASLFAVGAILGIAACSVLLPGASSNSCSKNYKQAGVELTFIGPQGSVRYEQPSIHITSSKPLFQDMDSAFEHRYYMPCGKNCHAPQRAFRSFGWVKSNTIENARVVHTDFPRSSGNKILSWQRFNHIYNRSAFTKRDNFLSGMASYKNSGSQQRNVYFLPETYRMHNEQEKKAFQFLVKSKKAGKYPWIFHTGEKKWLEDKVIPVQRSQVALKAVIEDERAGPRSLELGICNQLPYSDGQNLMIRVFWLVASTDPLIVMYQDGFARIGYNETDSGMSKYDDRKVDFDTFEQYLWSTWKQSRALRRSLEDPVVHVRNQMKDSIATVVDAFRRQTFTVHPDSDAEDGYEAFAMDFLIDTDMDVWMINQQYDSSNPHSLLTEDYYFLLTKNHELWAGMASTLNEIWHKQATGANILPLEKTGKWQLIVAGDKWAFQYEGYTRTNKRKDCKKNPKKKPKKRKRPAESEDPDEDDGELSPEDIGVEVEQA